MKRFETEKLKQQLRVQVEDELKVSLKRELSAEIEKEVEGKLRVNLEREAKERQEKEEREQEREKKKKVEEESGIVQTDVENKEKKTEEEKEREKKERERESEEYLRALKASLSQDVFKLVYSEISATEAIPRIEEVVVSDLRDRVTRRLEAEMNIRTSANLRDDKLRGRSRSSGQETLPDFSPPATPVTLKQPIRRGGSVRGGGKSGGSGAGSPAGTLRQSPQEVSPMAIFAKIANMDNYLVSPRHSVERKYRRNSVTPMMLRRMTDEAMEKEREDKGEGSSEGESGGVGGVGGVLEAEREVISSPKFSTLPPRFAADQGLLLQQLRESLKHEGDEGSLSDSAIIEGLSPVVPVVDAIKSPVEEASQQGTTTTTTTMGGDGETKAERGGSVEGGEVERKEDDFVEDLLSEQMVELRQRAIIKLAAARTVEGDEEGVREKDGEVGGGSARGSGRIGRVEWIRTSANSPGLIRRDANPLLREGEEDASDLDEREKLVAELQSRTRSSVPGELRELALGLEGIDMGALNGKSLVCVSVCVCV